MYSVHNLNNNNNSTKVKGVMFLVVINEFNSKIIITL